MTYKEALQIISQNLAVAVHDADGINPEYEYEQVKALDMAYDAIEKQIPMNPVLKRIDDEDEQTGEKYFWYFWLCPVCGEHIGVKYNRYCSGCGQAIKWEEEK